MAAESLHGNPIFSSDFTPRCSHTPKLKSVPHLFFKLSCSQDEIDRWRVFSSPLFTLQQ